MLGKNAHIIVCGFPRAGVSLLYYMLAWALPDEFKRYPRQTSAFRVLNDPGPKLTFAPSDLFWIKELAIRSSDVRFLVVVRDPRGVLTSKDSSGQYCIDWDKSALPNILGLKQFYEMAVSDAVLSNELVYRTSFEDIVCHSQPMRERISTFLGIRLYGIFEEFHLRKDHQHLKPLDFSRVHRWKNDKGDMDRVHNQITRFPEIKIALDVLGYSGGRSWLDWR